MTVPLPVLRIAEECLARIEARDMAIHAMVHVDRDGALTSAHASASRWVKMAPLSPLDGMPVAIKANIAVEGWPWHAGIAAYADRVASGDAACVRRLRDAGAVLIGLTNMDEGALGAVTDNPWFGRTHNPYRQGFTAGGSSGGSAAAVAAGFCVAALGTDTIGSIRIPATYCGVVGHKPRRGQIPTYGVVPLSSTLDHIGVVASSPETCAEVSTVLRGTARSRGESFVGKSVAALDWRGAFTVSAEIEAAFDALLDAAGRAGMTIERVPSGVFPFARAQRLLLAIAEIEGAAVHHDALRDRPEGFSSGFSAMLAWGAAARSSRYEAGLQELQELCAFTRRAIAPFDALLLPATAQTAFAFDTAAPRDQALFATLGSTLGIPATSFPIGRSREGLPIGAQVVAESDGLCLSIAAALYADQCGSSPPDTFIDSAVI